MSKIIVFFYLIAFSLSASASECEVVAKKVANDFVKTAEYYTGMGIGLNGLIYSQHEKVYKFSVYEEYYSYDAYEVSVETVITRQSCLVKSVSWTKAPY